MANKWTVSTVFSAVDKMTAPIDRMNKSATGLGKNIGSVMGKIGSGLKFVGSAALGAGAAIGTAAIGIYKMAEGLSNAGDEIAKTARSIGISTGALQEFRYIGERSGVTVDEMTVALKKLTINVGDASSGVQKSLASLGLTAEQMKAAGPDQALNLIADGMARIADPAQRAAIAVDLFGKGGVKMANVLGEGRDGLSALAKEAHRLGYVLDDEILSNAETLNDTILNMQTAFKALGNQLAAVFLPIVNSAVSDITEFFVQIRPTFQAFAQRFSTVASKIMGFIGKILPVLMDLITGLLDALGPILDNIIPLLADMLSNIVPIVTDLATKLIKSLGPAIQSIIRLVVMVADKFMQILAPILRVLTPILEKLGPLIATVAEKLMTALGPVFDKLVVLFDKIFTAMAPAFDALASAFVSIVPTLVDLMIPAFNLLLPLLDLFAKLIEFIAPFIKMVADGIKFMADALIGFINNVIKPIAEFFGAKFEAPQPVATTPMSTNTQVLQSTTTNRSTVDVNFNNTPAGTTARQTGQAPGINLNLGTRGGGYY